MIYILNSKTPLGSTVVHVVYAEGIADAKEIAEIPDNDPHWVSIVDDDIARLLDEKSGHKRMLM